jgi:hypothetical protein
VSEDVQKLRQEAIDLYWETCTGNAMAEARVDALIAAVRAEESQRWREGVEAMRVAGGDFPKRVHNSALAALAARMEAK